MAFWTLWVLGPLGFGPFGFWTLWVFGPLDFGPFGFWILWILDSLVFGPFGFWTLWLMDPLVFGPFGFRTFVFGPFGVWTLLGLEPLGSFYSLFTLYVHFTRLAYYTLFENIIPSNYALFGVPTCLTENRKIDRLVLFLDALKRYPQLRRLKRSVST